MQTLVYCWIFTAFFAVSDQNSQRPMPQGRNITGRDGDTILLNGDDRVRIIRRRQAIVRSVFDPSRQWVILIADFAKPDSDPDGLVDTVYSFRDITGAWPLGARWEGQVVIEEHSGEPGPQRGIVLRTGQGAIQLYSGPPQNAEFQEPGAIAVVHYSGSGRNLSMRSTFDQAEQRAVAELERNLANNAERARQGLPGMTTFSSEGPAGGVATGTLVGPYVTPRQGATPPTASGPIRVGGAVAPPRKIHDVPAVLPEDARRAGVRGMVIVELTIGVDGAVTDARVLRSIPLLDQAALDAVRQWRYEPTLLNNQPVSVKVTAVVSF